MRGNTNVKDGIFLNATVDEYEVATGENIVAGNMVTMYTQSGEPLSDGVAGANKPWLSPLQKLSNGKYIGLNSKILSKQANKSFTVDATLATLLQTLNTINIGNDTFMYVNAYVQSYKLYVAVTVYVLNSDYSVTTYTKTSYSSADITNQTSPTVYFNMLDSLNGYVVGYLSCEKSSVQGHGLFHIDYSDLSDINIIFDEVGYASTTSALDYEIKITSRLKVGNNLYYCDGRSVYKFYFNGSVFTRAKCLIRNNEMFSPMLYKVEETGQICLLYRASQYSVDTNNLVCSVSNFVKTSEITDVKVVQTSSDSRLSFIQLTSTKFVIGYPTGNTKWNFIVVDTSNGLMIGEVNTISYGSSTGFFTLGYFTSLSDMDITVGKNVANAKIINEQLVLTGENKQYVKNATNEIYVRGVAKQSGTAGDTIEVYIPTV